MAASAREIQNLITTVVGLQGNPVSNAVPVVGDALVWDGSQWLPAAPPPPAPPLNGPIIGVTDGSNAAPGMVGEFLSTNTILNTSPPLLSSSIDLASLTLSPGDWDVSGFANVFIAYEGAIIGPGNQWTVSLYTGGSMIAGASNFFAIVYTSTAISNRMGTPPARINSASPTTVTLRVDGTNLQTVGGVTGNFTVSQVLIRARRMR